MATSYLFVRSADRSLGSSSAFSVALNTPYRNVKAISLVSAELPFSMFNVDNVYLQGVQFTHNGSTFNLVLSAGYYLVSDLCAAMLSALQAAFPSAGFTSVTYSSTSGKISIAYTSGLVLSVVSTTAGSLGRIVGTDPLGASTVASGGVLVMPYVVQLFSLSTLLMKIVELPAQCVTTNNMTCFARLQLAATPGGFVMLNNASGTVNTSQFPSPVATLSTLTVSLFTPDGQPANLHGCEWSFTLLIQASA